MYYLRAVRNRTHLLPATFNLAEAMDSFVDHLGGRASVYTVAGEAEADRVAVLFAMLIKPGPEQLDYVLIPDHWLPELGIVSEPRPESLTHPVLRDKHYEFNGLDRQGVREQLAQKFTAPGNICKRLNQKRVTALAKAEVEADAEGHAAALIAGKQRWWDRIKAQ